MYDNTDTTLFLLKILARCCATKGDLVTGKYPEVVLAFFSDEVHTRYYD